MPVYRLLFPCGSRHHSSTQSSATDASTSPHGASRASPSGLPLDRIEFFSTPGGLVGTPEPDSGPEPELPADRVSHFTVAR